MSDPGTDKQAAELLARRGHIGFSWDDLDAVELPSGVVTKMFRMTSDEDAPTIFNVYFPPGCRVDAHKHDCDYTEIILEGSQKVGATWHYAGDIRIGLANRGYGPLIAGDEGARVLFMFKDGRWPAIALGKTDQDSLGSHVIQAHLDAKEASN